MASRQYSVEQLQLQGTPPGSTQDPESTFRPERRKEAPYVLGSGVVEDDLMFNVGEIQEVPLSEFQIRENVSFNQPTLPPSRMGTSSRPGTALAGRPRSAQLSRPSSRVSVDDDDLDVEIQQADASYGKGSTYDSVIDPASRATLPCTARARAAAEAGNCARAWSSRPSSALGANGRVTMGALMQAASGQGRRPARDRHDSAPKLMEEENQTLLKDKASARPASRASAALPSVLHAVHAKPATQTLAPPVPPNDKAVEHACVDSEDSGTSSCLSSDGGSDNQSDSDSDDPPPTAAAIPGVPRRALRVSHSPYQALPESMAFMSSIRRVARSADQTSRPEMPSTQQFGLKCSDAGELAPQALHALTGSKAVGRIGRAGYPSQVLPDAQPRQHAGQTSAKQEAMGPLPGAPRQFQDMVVTQPVSQQSTSEPSSGHDVGQHSEKAGTCHHSRPAAGSADLGESARRPSCKSPSEPLKIPCSAPGHGTGSSQAMIFGELPSIQERVVPEPRRLNTTSLDESDFQGARRGSASGKTGVGATSCSSPSCAVGSLPHLLSAAAEGSVEKPASRTATPRLYYFCTHPDGGSTVGARRRSVERLSPLDDARGTGSAASERPDSGTSSDGMRRLVTQSELMCTGAESAKVRSPTTLMPLMPRPCGGGALTARDPPSLSERSNSSFQSWPASSSSFQSWPACADSRLPGLNFRSEPMKLLR